MRSLDKEKISESRVQIKDLVDYLQGKLSSRPEPTDSSAPLSNKGAGTQSSNEPSSASVPEMKVSFNTQEKMAWNTKKRYESSMMSKIKPLLSHIGSKNAVEVIGVRINNVISRLMVVELSALIPNYELTRGYGSMTRCGSVEKASEISQQTHRYGRKKTKPG